MAEELEVIQQPSQIALINSAEIDMQIATAKKYPRDLKKAKSNFLVMATVDEETAKKCFYKKPVDDKGTLAEGPSIRMAEIAVNVYGNIRYGARIVEESEKWIKVQGMCIDLENNLAYTTDISRSIWSEKGKYRYSQNLIQTTTKAAMAIALRDAVFKVVPMGYFKAEMDQVKAKATGRGGDIPLTKRVENAFAYFKKQGITDNQIMELLKIRGKDEITEDHLEVLVGLRTGIEDKEFTAEEAFRSYAKERQEQKAANVAQGVKNLRNKKEEAPQDAPKESAPEGDPSAVDPEDLTPEEREQLQKQSGQGKLI